MKNIVLIGMPGAGKSTIGVLLAKTLKMPFVDTDLIIQQQKDSYLQEIIDKHGIEDFLDIEEGIVSDLNVQRHVIATGGSVVYRENTMNQLKRNGLVIYLALPFIVIEERVNNIKTRGIAMNKSQTLREIYSQRTPLYEKYADITIRCNNRSMESIVDEISTTISPLFMV